MLLLAFKPSHDGTVAAIGDHELLFSLECEKDSFIRHSVLTPDVLLQAVERLGEVPDVFVLGGWGFQHSRTGAGYLGATELMERPMRFFGKEARMFSSSHERSHIAMAVGMAPKVDTPAQAVLVYEGAFGSLYMVDERCQVLQEHRVIAQPGARYGFLYALADPSFSDYAQSHRLEDSGKLMALAAYGDPEAATPEIVDTVDRILNRELIEPPAPKHEFSDSVVYNAGVESEECKIAAALLQDRLFELFWRAAQQHLPPGLPLRISGGCGLNCEWNARWRDTGYFSSVFVPPCTDDSGSAIGSAIDALAAFTGDPHIDWTVYSGLEFVNDVTPDPEKWTARPLDMSSLATALSDGAIVGWVQGRWEIGPRALGNRSILAEPFDPATKDRLNEVKKREGYRPIAPCCRLEDVGKVFDDEYEDPYMLYFKRVRGSELGAVTHVDGTARVQTVSEKTNERLHRLLSAFAEQRGVGVLCNTSLNLKNYGFINRMSHLITYAEAQGLTDVVVGDTWYGRTETVDPGAAKARLYEPTGAVTRAG